MKRIAGSPPPPTPPADAGGATASRPTPQTSSSGPSALSVGTTSHLGGLAPRAGPAPKKRRPGALTLNLAASTGPKDVDLGKLRESSNGSTHFHGSRSGSLMTFHGSTPEDRRGHLLPMGQLIAAGAPVYSGERGSSLSKTDAFNANHLSAVNELNVDHAIEYATNPERARASPVISEGTEARLAGTANPALEALKTDDPAAHAMVNAKFPVVYGLKPSSQLMPADSAIPGEVGVKDGVKPEEIGAIFVPQEHVPTVQDLVHGAGHDKIPVASLESFKKE